MMSKAASINSSQETLFSKSSSSSSAATVRLPCLTEIIMVGWFKQFRPKFGRNADIKGKGTRSSADCCATSDQRPLLPPFAARLCQNKSATDLLTPSAPLAPAQRDCLRRLAPSALIRKSGQETVVGQAAHRLLLVYHPQPLKGRIIAREP